MKRFPGSRLALTILALAAAIAAPAGAQDLETFAERLTEHRLDNGLTVLIYPRGSAPTVSFHTLVDVGSAQEVPGITGIAHMFEHMAFKGTDTIGTTDYEKEKLALAKLDQAWLAYDRARRDPNGADPERLEELKKAFEAAQAEAQKYVVPNAYTEILERAGVVGLNASTGADATRYYYSLPANKVELWAYMESERFLNPVFREFFKERDVVWEERRMRTESNPIGRLIEQFLAAAFVAHTYRQPTVGYASDIASWNRQDAQAFFERYYVPSNMVIAIVGKVDPDTVLPIVERYFGRLAAAPPPPPLRTEEPKSIAEKTVVIHDPSQPLYVEGYHRPSARHPDSAVFDAISDVLSNGRTSRLYKRLVDQEKIAAQAGAFNGFPGTKYPHLMLFFAIPTPGHDNDEVQASLRAEIERLKNEPITDQELERVKTRAKANFLRGLDSNSGLAFQLATYQTLFGDWREMFRELDKIEAVDKDDIMRVARETFVATNRTVGRIETVAPEAATAAAQ